MLDLIVEGFLSLRFGCTVAFVLPMVGPAMALGRRAWLTPVALIAGAGTVGWARFADRWFDTPSRLILTVLAIMIVVAVLASFRDRSRKRPAGKRSAAKRGGTKTKHKAGIFARLGAWSWATAALSLAALVAGWLWVPCVGEHLSEPLNNARIDPLNTWLQVLAYVTGIAVPLIVLVALPIGFPTLTRVRDAVPVRMLGVGLSILVSVALAAGWYSELVLRFAPV